jgi:hypothetical protein
MHPTISTSLDKTKYVVIGFDNILNAHMRDLKVKGEQGRIGKLIRGLLLSLPGNDCTYN